MHKSTIYVLAISLSMCPRLVQIQNNLFRRIFSVFKSEFSENCAMICMGSVGKPIRSLSLLLLAFVCLVSRATFAQTYVESSIPTPTQGAGYIVAGSNSLRGEYTLAIDAPNQSQIVHLLVAGGQYDGSGSLQILDNYSYSLNPILTNFRMMRSADALNAYLAVDVGGNVQSNTVLRVQYRGFTGSNPCFVGSCTGKSMLDGSETNISMLGTEVNLYDVGIGTTVPQNNLSVFRGLDVDQGDGGNGANFPAFGISLGDSSGEGLASARNGGNPNQYGLDFYTGFAKRLSITNSGFVGIGTITPTVPLEINGSVKLTAGSGASIIFPDATIQSTAWNGTTLGGDYAESIDVLGDRSTYEPGDVITMDSSAPGKFTKSQERYSKLVSGVFSTKPGITGRRVNYKRPDKAAEVPMAMMGIVPTKVSTENGRIEVGDLLVSASLSGYAMKGTDSSRMMGAIIGKALAPLQEGTGIIEVLISLQ